MARKLLNIIDLNFNTLAITGGYESIVLKRKWNGIDYLNLTINKSVPGADKLTEDNIVFLDKEYDCAFIIERVVEVFAGNVTKLEIQATHINCLARDYITYPMPIASSDTFTLTNYTRENVVRNLLWYSAIAPEDATRVQYAMMLGTLKGYGASITFSTRYKNLADEIINVLSVEQLGWNITVDMIQKKFVFNVLKGADKSAAQSLSARILFGIKFGNLSSYEKVSDKTSEKNIAIVGGQGEGKDRTISKVIKSGITRKKEIFVDARDISDSSQLTERGKQKLEENIATNSITFQVIDKQFKYRVDWELGDIVTIAFPDGSYINKQIVGVEEIYEKRSISINPEFGTTEKDIMSVVSSIEQKVAALATNEVISAEDQLFLGTYTKALADLPSSYPFGISYTFVQAAQGWQSYGTVLTVKAFSGGGSTYQIYTPYSPTYGGSKQQIRFGNFDVNAGDSWTPWYTNCMGVPSTAIPAPAATIADCQAKINLIRAALIDKGITL